jgi:hypothetical protein
MYFMQCFSYSDAAVQRAGSRQIAGVTQMSHCRPYGVTQMSHYRPHGLNADVTTDG